MAIIPDISGNRPINGPYVDPHIGGYNNDGILVSGVDRSGSITTGGTAQVLAAANTSRAFLKGQNTSAGDLWIREVGSPAAVGGTASYKVVSGATFSVNTQNAISIIGATTGQTFAATEG